MAAPKLIEISYYPTVTGEKFHADKTSIVRSIMGPIGSGKSVTCVMEIFDKARTMRPGADGTRRSRWGVIRNTFPELRSTTIKTWEEWIPPQICRIKYDSPITGRMFTRLPDQTVLDLEVMFVSIDRPDDIRKLLSLELTGVWINEAKEVSKATLDMAIGRTGRYPPKKSFSKKVLEEVKEGGTLYWSGAILDTNPPDDDNWIYKMSEEECPDTWNFLRQPPAILQDKDGKWYGNPLAENIEHLALGYEYYLRQVPGKTMEWIKVFLQGEYGSVEDGKPVYPEFNRTLHVSETEVPPNPHIGLIASFDFGRTPAVAFKQADPSGVIRTLKELVTPDDKTCGLRTFLNDIVKPFIRTTFPDHNLSDIIVPVDPAGTHKNETDETACVDILREAGFMKVYPAKTNKPMLRIEATKKFLTTLIDGKAGFQVNPSCKYYIKGFNGGYKFRRMQVSGSDKYTDKPDKNIFSHIHDAGAYGDLYLAGDSGEDVKRQEVAETDWDPFGDNFEAPPGGRRRPAVAEHEFNPFA